MLFHVASLSDSLAGEVLREFIFPRAAIGEIKEKSAANGFRYFKTRDDFFLIEKLEKIAILPDLLAFIWSSDYADGKPDWFVSYNRAQNIYAAWMTGGGQGLLFWLPDLNVVLANRSRHKTDAWVRCKHDIVQQLPSFVLAPTAAKSPPPLRVVETRMAAAG